MRSLFASLLLILTGWNTVSAQDFAYVANSGTDNVSVIDIATNTIVATIPVGDVPVDIAVSPDGSTLVVVNATDQTLSYVDVASNTVTLTTSPLGSIPSDATFNAAGDRIYVSRLAGNSVDVFDLSGNLLTSISVPGGPTDISFRPSTSDLYVLLGSQGEATIVDGSTNTLTSTSILLEGLNAGTPTLPLALAFTPNGDKAYVANNSDFDGSIINASGGNTVTQIGGQFGGNAFINGATAAAVSPDGTKAYIVAEGGNQLLIIDTSTDAVIATAFIAFRTDPNAVAISRDNATAYVTGGSTDEVLLFDATTAAAGSPASIALPAGAVPRDIVISGFVDPCAGFPLVQQTQNEVINAGQSFNFNGTVLTTAGTFVDTLLSVDGCDSVEITLNLSVLPAVDPATATTVQNALNNAITVSNGGVNAAVLQPDGSIVTATAGFATLGGNTAPSTLFGTSDVSQHVLAILIQKLVENGQLALTAPLAPAQATLTLGGPYTGQNVEAALRHTSSAPDLTTGPVPYNDPASLIFGVLNTNWAQQNYAPIVQTFVASQPPGTPGTFAYSRTGFIILGELLENTLGQNLQDLLDANGITAAALNELQYFGTGNGNAGPFVFPSPASSYFFNLLGTSPVSLSDQTSPISSTGASGSLFATPRGMAGLMKAVYQDQTLLNATSLSNLQSFNAVSGRLGNAYGQGTERFNLLIAGNPTDFVGHTGDINYKSAFIYAPSLNTGAYVTANNNDLSDSTVLEIARQLINATQDPCAGFPSITQTIDTTICVNESFAFNGVTYNTSGTFQDTLLSAQGCDSVFVTINLNVNPTFNVLDTAEICDGESFQFGTQTLATSGTFTETFTAANGCDSTVTLTLTVNPTFTTSVSEEICDGESFQFGTQTLTTSGTFTETFTAANGCDSTVTLTLTVNPTFNLTVNETISFGDTFTFGGVTYSSDTTVTETFQTVNGCDSVVTLNLNVLAFVCTADAGTITADSTPVVLSGMNVQITATPDGNVVVPMGYSILYVLTSGTGLVIEQTSANPSFTVMDTGRFTIHTLVYNADPADPNFLDLGLVVPGTTTGGDVLGIINTNSLCADLDVTGAPIQVEAPFVCTTDAGTITADSTPVVLSGMNVQITATPDGNINVPAGYSVLYVLTSGTGLVIEQTSANPSFTVMDTGRFTIHTLVYNADPADPNFLNLGVIVPGTSTGFDVVNLINNSGLCADLDAAGAPIQVNAPVMVGLNAPTNLMVDNGTAFVAPLNWMDNSNNEDGFQIFRDGNLIATVGPDVTTFTDTLVFFGAFGITFTYEVRAFNATQVSAPSNQDTYAMPAKFKRLELTYVCYNPATDSLTWSVFNPNAQAHPFIYAQWWSPQRDTLFAQPGMSVTFQTKNNPQDPNTFGDDNITGIWWADETLRPGVPFDLITRHINLNQSCVGSRLEFGPRATKAGNLMTGLLARRIEFTEIVDANFLAEMIEVSPNPFSSKVLIDTDGMDVIADIYVINMLGQEVYKQDNVDMSQKVAIDLEKLADGVYTLKLDFNGVIYTKKIVRD